MKTEARCGPCADHDETAKEAVLRILRICRARRAGHLILRAYMSEDFREGLDCVLNKRTPNWKGNSSNVRAANACRWLWPGGFPSQLHTQIEGAMPVCAPRGSQAALIHPADNRIKIAAAYDVPLAADVQAADKSNQPGFQASFDDRVSFFDWSTPCSFESRRR
jgi:hypothetical protein